MSGTSLTPWFAQQFLDNNGLLLAGGKIYTYAAGTTTPLAAYADSSGISQLPNPIILDGSGRASIWLPNVAYKFVVKDSTDVTLYTVDNVTPFAIGDGSITTAKLADGAVTTAKIAASAVTTAKIADGAVTAAKLAAGVGILPDLAVGTDQAYATIGAAVAAASAGQSIYVRTGNYVENLVIDKQINIIGSGRGAILAGTLHFQSGSNFSLMQNMKILGGTTIDAGLIGIVMMPVFLANGTTIQQNNDPQTNLIFAMGE